MGSCVGKSKKTGAKSPPSTQLQTRVLTQESEHQESTPAPAKAVKDVSQHPEGVREKGDSFVFDEKNKDKLEDDFDVVEEAPEKAKKGLQVTKGGSFAFQEDVKQDAAQLGLEQQQIAEFIDEGLDGLNLDESDTEEQLPVIAKPKEESKPVEESEIPPTKPEVKAPFETENWDEPTYAKLDRQYKLGDAIDYAPVMKKPISFTVEPKGKGKPTKITYGYESLAGQSAVAGGTAIDKPNQDSVAILRMKKFPERAIFGIFDGHGPFGEHASHFCRMEMMKMYQIAMKQHPNDSPEKLIAHTLRYLHRKFGGANGKYKKGNVDAIVSGTTAVVVLIDGNRIVTANVGDSRAILATRIDSENFKVDQLSEDHKPERDDERRRILASKAKLLSEETLRGVRTGKVNAKGAKNAEVGDETKGKLYICRVLPTGEIVYGVLFTRSIGDMDAHKNLGVSADPEFVETFVSETLENGNEQAIILASDGVWDMMSNEECAVVALTFEDPLEASREIVKRCKERWGESGEGRRDDITCCVVGLGSKFVKKVAEGI